MDNIVFRELPTQSKLPSPSLALMMQDKEGYFWYGTNGEGLCRDDGYNIKVYNSKDVGKGIMDNDEVTCFCEDRHNRIWFGTRMGLYILDKQTEQIKNVTHPLLLRKKVNCICMDSDGKMWVGVAQSIIKFDKGGKAGHNCAQYERSYKFRQHDHFIDLETESVMEFCDPRLLEIQRSIEEQLGVEITHHSLIFYGHKKS